MMFRRLLAVLAITVLCLIAVPLIASAEGTTEIAWLGHAAFKIATPSGKVLLIDPWVVNPVNKKGADIVAAMDKVDLILLTHGHGDHVGNSVEIAKKTGAKLVATFDLARAMAQFGGFPAHQAGMDTMGHFGGTISLLDGEVLVTFVPALHGSGLEAVEEGPLAKKSVYASNPGGFVIAVKNGPVIYHTGDTDVFSDMALISRFSTIDIMLACIGDRFTMGPERAAYAVKLVNPKIAVPMHYGTFPLLTGTPEAFEKEMKKVKAKAKMRKMDVNGSLVWP
jgi:L-ascorbate metabolism protein UlaG (beta-lactamase superfamily)